MAGQELAAKPENLSLTLRTLMREKSNCPLIFTCVTQYSKNLITVMFQIAAAKPLSLNPGVCLPRTYSLHLD